MPVACNNKLHEKMAALLTCPKYCDVPGTEKLFA